MAGFLSLPQELRLMIFENLLVIREPSIYAFDVRRTRKAFRAKLILSSKSAANAWQPATDPSALVHEIAKFFGARLPSDDEWVAITAYESDEAPNPTEFLIRRQVDVVHLSYDQGDHWPMGLPIPWHKPGEKPWTASGHGPDRVALHPISLYHGMGLEQFILGRDSIVPDDQPEWHEFCFVFLITQLIDAGTTRLYILGPIPGSTSSQRGGGVEYTQVQRRSR
ncbi:hypothetical protein FSARC_9819 [Fusarium sarcochroum]|uniref:Uncharacterized protein n=1 Tax=Fusarium sarcochroum TaxID=1208366 RepID=A0A8H4TQ69_9HYPO|nr:hypothetical protein FSARC_9819 [Fusarium sarcochroum]